ncbi:MAG: tetratricopeptide repeat protein [Proteobacteria bacterium]|nr:tetratricopeptide repeat protein [Pseudomonadota bacterium]MBU1543748.1 tetratricopeptide repeat protein [Pseudomonadota bacterium]MBU2430831.1 tetratricopeptide repeat protein [Pseudomonadota bacterium]MBU2481449.1 tetratricopeptide repeat protein [Pseudomonadota bacterium]
MQEDNKLEQGHVTKQNAIMIGLICLMVGFTIGVVYSSYKLKPTVNTANTAIVPENNQTIDYRQKEIELKNELSQNPENASAWVQLGHVYFDTDQYVNAIEAYKKSLSIEPGNANVLTDIGVMYRYNKQPQDAIKSFDEAISADPKHEWARFHKGVVLMKDLDEKDKALTVWEALLSINPTFMSSKDQSLEELITHYKEHK